MREGVYHCLEQVPKEVGRAREAVPARRSLASEPGKLFVRSLLSSIGNFVRKRTCVDGVRVSDGDVPTLFVKLGLTSEGLRTSLDDYI